MHKGTDHGQLDNIAYDVDQSFFNLSCLSFHKGYFHDPIMDSLEYYFQFGPMSRGLHLMKYCMVMDLVVSTVVECFI